MRADSEILGTHTVACQFNEFFMHKDYDWWYMVQPGDVVVDVGACFGMFTCRALDLGASKVYAVEPNEKLLKDTLYNAFPHIKNKKDSPVVPVNYAIGSDSNRRSDIFGHSRSDGSLKFKSFKDFVEEYNIDYIDYLKIDAEGGEYDIFTEENVDYLVNNVKHISAEFHLGKFEGIEEEFIKLRNNVLTKFDTSKFRYKNQELHNKIFDDDFIRTVGSGFTWMIYICNKSL